MQEIVGSLLYYARVVDTKLLIALSAIAAHQAKATVATEQAVDLLLEYNIAGNKFAGMDIEWNYAACRCRISMPGYLSMLLLKFKHPHHSKPQLSPYKCLPIAYCAKSHITADPDSLELLDAS
jgi:hypothetical protein